MCIYKTRRESYNQNLKKMAKIYKVYICDSLTEDVNDIICFRPSGDGFADFMEEIFSRMPGLRTENLKVFYEGKSKHFYVLFIFPLYF